MRLDPAVLADHVVLAATAGFALVAFILLVRQGFWLPAGAAAAAVIYGSALVLSSLCSLIYNTLHKHKPAGFWRMADHLCIFLLIAGTYTPFSVLGAEGRAAWLLAPIWALALIGGALKLAMQLRHENLFVLLYVGMGWMVLFGLGSIIRSFSPATLALLLIGGLAYTGGTLFHIRSHRWRWGAPAWHTAVLIGITTHFAAIFGLVVVAG
jgi:hemolysin III